MEDNPIRTPLIQQDEGGELTSKGMNGRTGRSSSLGDTPVPTARGPAVQKQPEEAAFDPENPSPHVIGGDSDQRPTVTESQVTEHIPPEVLAANDGPEHLDGDEEAGRRQSQEEHHKFLSTWRAKSSESLEHREKQQVEGGEKAEGDDESGDSNIRSAHEDVPDQDPSRQNSHAFTAEIIADLLETDLTHGLDSAEAKKRLAHYGPNKLHDPPVDTFLMRLGRQLNDVLTWILIATAIISAGLQSWAEFVLIIGIVIINITIGMVQEGKAAKATAALKQMLAPVATVIRDGQRQEVDARDLVPGDLVFVESGSKVPADLRISTCTNLAVQESMLTGESLPTQKNAAPVALNTGLGDRSSILYSATSVVRGQGYGLVVATGDTTEIGRIAELVSEVQDSKSELLQQIDAFGIWIGTIVIPSAVVAFLVAYLTPVNLDDYYTSDQKWKQALIIGISVAVSMIPAGLPAIITICMAVATQEMARKKAIVKTLPSVEVLGAVSVICSDKTGTLTKNEMTVVAVRTRHEEYAVQGVGYDWMVDGDRIRRVVHHKQPSSMSQLHASDQKYPAAADSHPNPTSITPVQVAPGGDSARTVLDATETAKPSDQPSAPEQETEPVRNVDQALQNLVRAGLLNNESRLERAPKQVLPIGDPTECSLLCLGYKLGYKSDTVQHEFPRVAVIPFESEHKFMVTFHSHAGDEDPTRLVAIVKGAPDRLLPKCHSSMLPDGTLLKDDPEFLPFWQAQVAQLSSKGYRCLALCQAETSYQELPAILKQGPTWVSKNPGQFMTLLGVVAILDPPRSECIQAIKDAHIAGIVVKMITGDHPSTAKAIGKALGIVDETHSTILTGPQLDEMTNEDLAKVVRECNVFARASPDNKISIVRALQSHDLICSMTGDGVNDAPALRAADIGVAMGITGTDVSKDAAKMILTDDNFATILVAVQQGRRVWDNLRKIVLFNMPANFAQAGIIFIAVCLQWDTIPLTAIQVLYVNMVIACSLGLILALEPAEPMTMTRPPRSPGKGFIGKMFYWRLFFVSFIFILFVLLAVVWTQSLGGYSSSSLRAVAFNCLVICQTFYAFNCRFLKLSSLHPRIFRGNLGAWFCAVLVIALNVFLTYTPVVNEFFGMSGMDGLEWLIVIFFGVMTFLIVELEKALTDPLKPCYEPIVRALSACLKCIDRYNVLKILWTKSRTRVKRILKTNRKLRHGGSLRAIKGDPTSKSRKKLRKRFTQRIKNLVKGTSTKDIRSEDAQKLAADDGIDRNNANPTKSSPEQLV